MIIRICVIFSILLSHPAFGSEYSIDLKLHDLQLTKYEYASSIDERERIHFRYRNEVKSYFMYVPNSSSEEMPIVVALHGAGRSGSSMIDAWRNCSTKHGFMVVAPNGVGNDWDISVDDSGFVKESIKDALVRSGKKAQAVYLFGHSNGARKAIALAALNPSGYAAVVAHAGTVADLTAASIIQRASVLPKVGLFLGDRDHIFSVDSARKTAAWLERNGYATSLFVMQNHGHWYYEDFDRINESVWAFLSKK